MARGAWFASGDTPPVITPAAPPQPPPPQPTPPLPSTPAAAPGTWSWTLSLSFLPLLVEYMPVSFSAAELSTGCGFWPPRGLVSRSRVSRYDELT